MKNRTERENYRRIRLLLLLKVQNRNMLNKLVHEMKKKPQGVFFNEKGGTQNISRKIFHAHADC